MSARAFARTCFRLLVIWGLFISPVGLGQGLAQESPGAAWASAAESVSEINALAARYFQGEGVGQDYTRAAELFLQAARRGSPLAQFNVGYLYEKGLGLPVEYDKAYAFYQAAAGHGYNAALAAMDNLRHYMSAEKIAEIEQAPLPLDTSPAAASPLADRPAIADQAALRSWLQSIKPAAGSN